MYKIQYLQYYNLFFYATSLTQDDFFPKMFLKFLTVEDYISVEIFSANGERLHSSEADPDGICLWRDNYFICKISPCPLRVKCCKSIVCIGFVLIT